MPPKRKNKVNALKETQKKQIQSRLMQIRLKVDAYVYKNRPISASDAKAYIDEVSEYKTQCAGDTRSLQVTEKLLCCMKSIIAEQEPGPNEKEATNNDEQYTQVEYIDSPVYSPADEDRTLLTQNILRVEGQDTLTAPVLNKIPNMVEVGDDLRNENSISKQTPKGSEVMNNISKNEIKIDDFKNNSVEPSEDIFNNTDLIDTIKNTDSHVENGKNSIKINDDIEIIDLCDDNDDFGNSQVPLDVATHRALSNLSLRDTKQMNIMEFECSQSILNDFETNSACTFVETGPKLINKEIQLSDENPVFKKPIAILYAKKGIHKTELDKKAEFKEYNNNLNKPNKGINFPKVNEDVIVRNIIETLNKNPVKLAPDASVKHNEVKLDAKKDGEKPIQQRKKRVPKIEKAQAAGIKNKDDKQVNKRGKRVNKKNAEAKTQTKIINIPIATNNTEIQNKETSNPKTENHTPIQNKNNIPNKEIMKIYTKNVVEDLSWVENIRYVREIAAEEYDPKLGCLNNDFWDNFILPPNLNDEDFILY